MSARWLPTEWENQRVNLLDVADLSVFQPHPAAVDSSSKPLNYFV
jgi:hypothetical protein